MFNPHLGSSRFSGRSSSLVVASSLLFVLTSVFLISVTSSHWSGPIIMTQIENELSGPSDSPYVEWLGQLATELKTNMPWIMCHGAHANNTIETYNGCDGTSFYVSLNPNLN